MSSGVPTKPAFYVMKAFQKIDQHLTRKELEKEEFKYKAVRDRVLAIGRKVK